MKSVPLARGVSTVRASIKMPTSSAMGGMLPDYPNRSLACGATVCLRPLCILLGWESITHGFMHCMDYGHNSNMTYAAKTPEGVNVGWTEFIWQLHMVEQEGRPAIYRPVFCWVSTNRRMRSIVTAPSWRFSRMMPYCKNMIIFTRERLVKYFTENPLKDNKK